MSKKNEEAVASLGLREDHAEMLRLMLDRLDALERHVKAVEKTVAADEEPAPKKK